MMTTLKFVGAIAYLEIAGGILLLPSGFFFFRSFTDNPYLSQLVRIQDDRAQRVVDTGIYGVVRHPMYLGAGLMFLGSTLLLGSLAGLLVGLGVICCSWCAFSAKRNSSSTIWMDTPLIA